MRRTALVTGANRGLGLAVAQELRRRGLDVVLTARDPEPGRAAAEEAGARFEALDVADAESVAACARRLAKTPVDVLVNNAGVYPAGDLPDLEPARLKEAMDVNFLGAFLLCRAFVPGMVRRGYGRVVNVSSGYGAFAEGLEGPAAYSLSKAALNALTLKLARSVPPSVKVNAACPGWVRTRMGGAGADLSVEEGADTIVWLALLPDDGPTGGFFREREPIPW